MIYNWSNPDDDQSKYVEVWYCPLRDGGSSEMPDYCLGEHSVLAELTYLKMWATIILVKTNEHRVGNCLLPTTAGPLANEIKNISTVRTFYVQSLSPNRIQDCIATFNSLNRFSMVAYPDGMHYDTFHKHHESLEDKKLFHHSTTKCNLRS